jgi:hypothetical protein
MLDMQAAFEKLQKDAVDCGLISQRATDAEKKELFGRIAQHLAMLASELESAIEAKRAGSHREDLRPPERGPRPR